MGATSPKSAADSDIRLLQRLAVAVAAGAVTMTIDRDRLTHIDSPVVVEADANVWVYGGIALTLAGFGLFGLLVGTVAGVVSLALYLTVGKAYVRRRLERRVRELALRDEMLWRRLWKFGGVTLARGDRAWTGPRDNWREAVEGDGANEGGPPGRSAVTTADADQRG